MDIQSTVQLFTGAKMPIIGYGTWGIKENVREATETAISVGFTMIDTSGDYGSQPGIGEALREIDVPRSSIYLVTKVEENDIIIQSYSPLTHGKRLDDGYLSEIGLKYDKTPSQVLIRWNLQHGCVPIIKAETPSHIKENISVFDFELTSEDMKALDGMNENFSALGEKPAYQS